MDFIGFNGFIMVAHLYKEARSFPATLSLIISIIYLAVAFLSGIFFIIKPTCIFWYGKRDHFSPRLLFEIYSIWAYQVIAIEQKVVNEDFLPYLFLLLFSF